MRGSGRDLPNRNQQEFMKEIYRKEDHARLKGYLKNAKYRERQKTGEFKQITVLRDRYLGGVPKPGGYYKRVNDRKWSSFLRTHWWLFYRVGPEHLCSRTSETGDDFLFPSVHEGLEKVRRQNSTIAILYTSQVVEMTNNKQ